jgi:hypothetical protein
VRDGGAHDTLFPYVAQLPSVSGRAQVVPVQEDLHGPHRVLARAFRARVRARMRACLCVARAVSSPQSTSCFAGAATSCARCCRRTSRAGWACWRAACATSRRTPSTRAWTGQRCPAWRSRRPSSPTSTSGDRPPRRRRTASASPRCALPHRLAQAAGVRCQQRSDGVLTCRLHIPPPPAGAARHDGARPAGVGGAARHLQGVVTSGPRAWDAGVKAMQELRARAHAARDFSTARELLFMPCFASVPARRAMLRWVLRRAMLPVQKQAS